MHAYIAQELARQREQELRRSAQRYLSSRSLRRRRRPVRHRAGSALVAIGLALARGSADA